jgi:hypothetical protein
MAQFDVKIQDDARMVPLILAAMSSFVKMIEWLLNTK